MKISARLLKPFLNNLRKTDFSVSTWATMCRILTNSYAASHGPFWPKLIMPLATVFVEIFLKEKNWRGFRPYLVTLWKEFEISLKKRRFEIFRTSHPSR